MLDKLTGTTIETQRKWLKFLLARVGHNNLPKLFNYYQSIGWISGSAAEKLLDIASLEKRYKGASWTLSAEEQRISRLFIEKLKGEDIEDSLLNVPFSGKARPDIEKKIQIKPSEHIHPAEKKKMEISIHRREVTINNLEQELEEKYAEIVGLKERIRELEKTLLKNQKEMMRKKIFMDIMDQNIKLKKAGRSGKNPKRSKESGSLS
ncbi:Archaeal flagella protein [uncultured archaeon]|nr:Archaeal flagella protein [uncultured archaeon]